MIYAISSLLGYLGLGSSPFLKASRTNLMPMILIMLSMFSLMFGNASLTTNLVLLMLVNLYDANCASNLQN